MHFGWQSTSSIQQSGLCDRGNGTGRGEWGWSVVRGKRNTWVSVTQNASTSGGKGARRINKWCLKSEQLSTDPHCSVRSAYLRGNTRVAERWNSNLTVYTSLIDSWSLSLSIALSISLTLFYVSPSLSFSLFYSSFHSLSLVLHFTYGIPWCHILVWWKASLCSAQQTE